MRNKFICLTLIVLILLPMVSANMMVIDGKRRVAVKNVITNLDDFPDYEFVSISGPGYLAARHGFSKSIAEIGNHIAIVRDNGLIPALYHFEVYAVHEDNFDEDFLNKVTARDREYIEYWINESKMEEYLDSVGVKVIESTTIYGERVSFLSINKGVENQFSVDLNRVKFEPDKTINITNDLVYFYLITPLIAMIIIVYLVWRKKNG